MSNILLNMDYTEIQSKTVNISNITANVSDEGESVSSSLEFEIQMENEKDFLDNTESIDILNLYEALDDKNKVINELKQRILNQQIQLAYYLHKNFCQENVLDYAKCVPIHEGLGLAIDTYIEHKDSGMHKLNCLHNKLQEFDTRVSNVIKQQEELVKSMSENTVKENFQNEMEDKHQGDDLKYSESVLRAASLDMYSRIMNATIQVKKELERLREYSAKVIQLEAERNILISYVLSIRKQQEQDTQHPEEQDSQQPEEQTQNDYILDDFKRDEVSIETESSLKTKNSESTLSKLFYESETKNSIGIRLRDVIDTIETKTESLVSLTKEQTNAYTDELQRLKKENNELSSLISKVDVDNCVDIKGLEDKCNSIADDLNEIQNGLESELYEKNKEISLLEEKVKESVVQSLELEEQILDLKQSVDAICAENHMLNQIINDILQKKSNTAENIELKDIIENQKDQIRNLMLIICKMNSNEIINPKKEDSFEKHEKPLPEELKDSGVVSCSDTESKICFTPSSCRVNSQAMQEPSENGYGEPERDNPCVTTKDSSQSYLNETNNHPLSPSNTQYNSKRSSIGIRHPTVPTPKFSLNTQFTGTRTTRRNIKNKYSTISSLDNVQTTSLHVESCNVDGKKESMKATLECSNAEGVLEMTSSSQLHLKLQYTTPTTSTNSLITLHNPNISKSKTELDEIDQQINQIKNEAQNSLDKRNVIENIRSIYSQLFGGNTDSG